MSTSHLPAATVVALLFSLSIQGGVNAEMQRTAPHPVRESPGGTTAVEAASPFVCGSDCVRSNADRAIQACAPRIEAEAPNDFDWITRPYGGIFQEADTPDSVAPTVVRYRGDSIRFLNGQREWTRIIYECGWDAVVARISYVRIRVGRLGKPKAVVSAPALRSTGIEKSPSVARLPMTAPSAAPATTSPVAPTLDRKKVGEPTLVEVRQVLSPAAAAR